jgi:putative addiction module component (TIGR02574 family)
MATQVDTKQLLKLTPRQRLRVIAELWESLVRESASIPLDAAALDEAESRIDELEKNPGLGIPLESLRERRGWKK